MNRVKSTSRNWPTLSLPLLVLPLLLLAALMSAGVAFAGLPAGNTAGMQAQDNIVAQGTPTQDCPPGWSTYPNPAPPGESTLYGVTTIGPNDIWAVGYYNDNGTQRTLAVRGDGTSWSRVPSPNPGSGHAVLRGVAGVAPNDVWAVGSYVGGTYNTWQTLIEHWDGTSWTVVPSPNGFRSQNHLYAVTAIASNDVWAVGETTNGGYVGEVLIMHWNGITWTHQVGPQPSSFQARLYGIVAVSPTDVWAVGQSGQRPLINHWNGSAWSTVPNPASYGTLYSVAAVGANDVWAVGHNGGPQTIIQRWNGSAWSIVPSPNPGATTNRLYGVTTLDANNVLAVGDTDQESGGGLKTLAVGWDGSAWTQVPTPNNPTGRDRFYGVTKTAGGVVWAVGTYGCASGCAQNALIARYGPLCFTPTPTPAPCNLAWRTVPNPNQEFRYSYLYAVGVVSANDVWAVGVYYPNGSNSWAHTLTEHWDGTSWSIVPSPSPNVSFLNDVAVVSANDVWAVGDVAGQTLTLHWDGSSWNIVPSPNAGSNNYLYGVAAVSANDVWAVGSYHTPNGPGGSLTLHWDGSSWNIVPSPGTARLNDVAAVSANDVWAVGSYFSGYSQTQTLHWDGSSWNIVPSPNQGTLYNILNGVAVVSANDVWAVGYYQAYGGSFRTLIERWNGSSWSIVPSPNPGAGDNQLHAITAIASNDVWAVGVYADGPHRTLAQHWDGSSWSVVPSPNGHLYGVAAVAANDIWAVGSRSGSALTERYHNPCAGATITPTNTPMRTSTPTRTTTSVPPTFTSTGVVPSNTVSVPSNTTVSTPTVPSTPAPTTCAISFTDVDLYSPFYIYIRCLACRGIVSGYDDGTFRPNNLVTRGQVAKIVSNAAGFEEDPGPQIYEDVPPSSPFYPFINRLSSRSVMSGYPCGQLPSEPCVPPHSRPYFRPNLSATRGQLAKIVCRASGRCDALPPPTSQTFEDNPTDAPFYEWIEKLASLGVMGGYQCGGPGEPCRPPRDRAYFRPHNFVTRGQTSKIVAQTFFPGCVPFR